MGRFPRWLRLARILPLATSCFGCDDAGFRRDEVERHQARAAEVLCADFLAHVRARDYGAAHGGLHRVLRERLTVAQLREAILLDPFMPRHTGAATFDVGSAAILGTLEVDGDDLAFECHHMAEGAGARVGIVSLVLAGVPVVSAPRAVPVER